MNFEGREAKGLLKGRYDKTFAGEDENIQANSKGSDQFAGPMYHIVGNPMSRLIYLCSIRQTLRINLISSREIFHAFLSSVDFYQNHLFQKLFQEYHLSIKQIGSRSGPTFCRA